MASESWQFIHEIMTATKARLFVCVCGVLMMGRCRFEEIPNIGPDA